MREIKFRAWVEEVSKMIPWEYLNLELEDGYGGVKDNSIHDVLKDVENQVTSHFELMQYTGLKDKNGKDIWEDDRFRSHLSAGKSVGTIKYSEDGFKVIWDEPNYGCLNDILRIHAEDGEVIGNIYESPSEVTP